MISVLLATPETFKNKYIQEVFSAEKITIDTAVNGKEAQLKLSKTAYSAIIIDCNLTNHSFLLVVKFCKLMHPKTMVILKTDTMKTLEDMDFKEKELLDLGVGAIAHGSKWIESSKSFIKRNAYSSWQNVEEKEINQVETLETNLSDKLFTEIHVDNFLNGAPAIFDLYIRIGTNKYIKILQRGNFIDPVRIKNYKNKYNLVYLHFKTEERLTFVNYINTFIEKSSKHVPIEKRIDIIGEASKKYVEEVYVHGLNEKIYDEGIRLANNTYNSIQQITSLKDLFIHLSQTQVSHLFLTSIYSIAIIKNVDWAGSRTHENIIMGCFLHDIGLIKLDFYQRNKNFKVSELTKFEYEEYKKHPIIGYEMLVNINHIPEAIRQITLQHHELCDGSGFPYGLTSNKIYPLAKVIGLASYFSHLLIENKIRPLDALRKFIPDANETVKFDPHFIKALVKGFL